MIELEKNTIDIGRDPGKAMEKISQPILDALLDTVSDGQQPILEDNMFKKGKLELEETDLNSNIYD